MPAPTRLHTLPLAELEPSGANAPIHAFEDLVRVTDAAYAVRLQAELDATPLDALLVDRGTSQLVVSLHGALNRGTTALPRFERLRMLLQHDVSCLFFGDPTLHRSDAIQLAWYTGWDGVDVQREIARRSEAAAAAIGARTIVFTGSSGGGFAALQVSALVPGSVALAFNAQTEIAEYRVNGTSWGVQREYVRTVWPAIWDGLASPGVVEDGAWTTRLDDRISAVRRYSSQRGNRVYLVQNEEEFHHEEHFLPFLAAARAGGNEIIASTNREGTLHNPPRGATFDANLRAVLDREGRGLAARTSTA